MNVAKKVRRKLEEEEAAAFEFPVFDEVGFVSKEFELMGAYLIAVAVAVLLGILAWVATVGGGLSWFPFPIGIAVIAASPYLIQRLRARAVSYTKGDWAGIIMLEFFGFLALWFVLLDISPHSL